MILTKLLHHLLEPGEGVLQPDGLVREARAVKFGISFNEADQYLGKGVLIASRALREELKREN